MRFLKILHRLWEMYWLQIVFVLIGLALIGTMIATVCIVISTQTEAEVIVEPQLVWVEVKEAVETYDFPDAGPEREDIAPTYILEDAEPTHPYLSIPLSLELQDYVWATAGQFGLDPYLVFAVIYVESGFDSNAISVTNDYGLMQVNTCNHQWIQEKYGVYGSFLDPYLNILGGCDILSSAVHKTSNLRTGLMSYNLGEGGASYLWSQGIYTSEYAEKVMGMYEYYKQEVGH